MIAALIEASSVPELDVSRFKDHYAEKLMLFLAFEGHLQEFLPGLAVPSDFAHLVPSLLIEFNREPDRDSGLLISEAPFHAPLDEFRFHINRLGPDIMS